MDFRAAATGRSFALDWFGQLQQDGRACSTIDFSNYFSDDTGVPPQYESAVAWHNIVHDGRLEPEDRRRIFGEIIDAAWDDSTGRMLPPLVDILNFWRRVLDVDLERWFQEEMCTMGPPPEILPTDSGYEMLCSLVQPRFFPDEDEYEGFDWPLVAILEDKNPIVWLTRYEDLRNCLEGGTSAEEALCRAGLWRSESKPIYLLMVETQAIFDDLRIPTVADSRLNYLFGATNQDDGPTGMTRHVIKGKGYGVPEFVVRRGRLLEVHEQALDAGNPSPVRIHEQVWESGTPHILRNHAEIRWRDEIEPII